MTDWGWWAGSTEEYMNIGGPFATREEAIKAGQEDMLGDPFWIVEACLHKWQAPDAWSVMDMMADNTDEFFYEDGFPGWDAHKDVVKAAEDDLQSIMNEWLKRWQMILPTPTAFSGCGKAERIEP